MLSVQGRLRGSACALPKTVALPVAWHCHSYRRLLFRFNLGCLGHRAPIDAVSETEMAQYLSRILGHLSGRRLKRYRCAHQQLCVEPCLGDNSARIDLYNRRANRHRLPFRIQFDTARHLRGDVGKGAVNADRRLLRPQCEELKRRKGFRDVHFDICCSNLSAKITCLPC